MIVDKRISFIRLFKVIWLKLLMIVLVALLTVGPLIYFELSRYAIDRSIPLVFGTAIAIFLGFRTNSAYERWWEARKLWGAILNDSLNLGRQARMLIKVPSGAKFDSQQEHDTAVRECRNLVREICYRQIAWAYSFNWQLKELPIDPKIESFLTPEEYEQVTKSPDPALMLLLKQGDSLAFAYESNWLDVREMLQMHITLNRITDRMGGCNRTKATNFPTHYSYFTKVFIWIFLVLLGFSLPSWQEVDVARDELGSYIAIPAIILIGWVFFMVDGISEYMQSPFENNRNVIPMETLAQKIEIGLRMTLDETDLPQPLKPKDGVLD